ncbi:XisI protein [Anaerolineae bacterium CFX7]|nr:XisI protein [Anaerolineae bacterium CFX7]
MDRVTYYRHIIERILAEHLEYIPKEREIETIAVVDDQSNNFLLLDLGWQPTRRIHSVIFHLRIKDDKIWIEQDWTEDGVARDLLRAGVPPDDIILGFQPPDMRPYAQELLKVA